MLTISDQVRTSPTGTNARLQELAHQIYNDLNDKNGQRILHNIKVLRERFEPEVVKAPRRAKAA